MTEVWLTPVVLLPGIALLIVSTAQRFSRVHDEIHRLLDHDDERPADQARNLYRRAMLFRNALSALYASVAFFALGALVGGLNEYWALGVFWIVTTFTLLGVVGLVYAAGLLMYETFFCLDIIHEHFRELRRDDEPPRS